MAAPYALYKAADGRRATPDGRPALKLMPSVARTCVADIFFSAENVAALQHGLRYGVYVASGGRAVVGAQSADELSTVMRSVYLSDGRNLPHSLLEQVRELNRAVLAFCVPRVAREALMYVKYRADSTTQPVPLRYGAYTSRSGTRGGGG